MTVLTIQGAVIRVSVVTARNTFEWSHCVGLRFWRDDAHVTLYGLAVYIDHAPEPLMFRTYSRAERDEWTRQVDMCVGGLP